MTNRFFDWFADGVVLLFFLFTIASSLIPQGLGIELPLPNSAETWELQEHPLESGVCAGVCIASLAVLWFIQPQRRAARGILGGVLLCTGLVGTRVLSSPMFLTFILAAIPIVRPVWLRMPPPTPSPGPGFSPLVFIIPFLLALAATLIHVKTTTGAWLPQPPPEERLLRSHHYLSAATVMSPPIEDGSRMLVLDSRFTREQLLDHVRKERTGWWAAEVLQTLDKRKRLAALPLTDEARVRALPLDSDVLVTPEGAPMTGHPLWGVVIEAEGPHQQRRLLVSLGTDDPARSPAPTYALLFEESSTGGPPRLLQAEHVFPSAAGIIIDIPRQDFFFLYLVGFLFVSLLVTALRHDRQRILRARQSTAPPSGVA